MQTLRMDITLLVELFTALTVKIFFRCFFWDVTLYHGFLVTELVIPPCQLSGYLQLLTQLTLLTALGHFTLKYVDGLRR